MVRLFRLLLRFYPRELRNRFGDAMVETFQEEWASVRGRGVGATALFALRSILRTPLLGLEERAHGLGAGLGSGGLTTDLAQVARSILRSPGFSLGTALTVGLGIGATVSIFAVADATVLRDLPVSEPDRLVRFAEDRDRHNSSGPEGPRVLHQRFEALHEALTGPVFSDFAGHGRRGLSIRADGHPFSAAGGVTTGNYFETLGLRPAVGRFYSSDDEASLVLGHRLWLNRFAGDPDVVGQSVSISGRPFTIVGVAPADFASTISFIHLDAFIPVGAYESAGGPSVRLNLFGRLSPDLDLEAARARATPIVTRVPDEVDTSSELRGAELTPMTPTPPSMSGPLLGFLGLLFGMAVLVLLIAAANVAGILVARAARRERETAVRLALGIGRGRLARQWLIETVGLFTVGGLVGLGISVAVTGVLSSLSLPVEQGFVIQAAPGLPSLAFALAVAIGAGFAFGTIPALYAARSEVAPRLRDGQRGTSLRGSRTRGVFVASQLALSVVLLIVATLFVRTAQESMAADVGFDPDDVIIAQVSLSPHGYSTDEGRRFYDRLIEATTALPDVEAASLASLTLMTGSISSYGGWRLSPEDDGVSIRINRVDASYFELMGIEVAAGRTLDANDTDEAPDVIVINESFARRFWPDGNPIGKTILRSDRPYEVVGVVSDGRYVDFDGNTGAFVFLSIEQHYTAERSLHLKARPGMELAGLIRAVREEVAQLDPDIAVTEPMHLESAMSVLLFPQRLAATLIGVFGLLGLFLAATGVYSVLAQQVVRRAREFGVRLALGARPGGLLRRVLRSAIVLAAIGAGVGIAFSAGVSRLLSSLLLGLSPFDPVAFVGVPIVLGIVALAAATLPALRILRLDPVETLKEE